MIESLSSIDIIKDIPTYTIFNISGVYVLKLSLNIIYIGESGDVYKRIHQHRKDKLFDTVSIILIQDEKERKVMEAALIREHNPVHNKTHTDHYNF